jgi:hypothetical protein
MEKLKEFNADQISTVNSAVEMAEELVSNFYKMSASQWLRPKYDVKTIVDLNPEEILDEPFAQIIRYKGQRKDTSLGSSAYDFYKICLQDHCILMALEHTPGLKLFPFTLYIVTHELIHIVRFSKFLQSFDASPEEKIEEETRVHKDTHQILSNVQITGITTVLDFYNQWRQPFDKLRNP